MKSDPSHYVDRLDYMQQENDKCIGEHRPQVPCLCVRGIGVLDLDLDLE